MHADFCYRRKQRSQRGKMRRIRRQQD